MPLLRDPHFHHRWKIPDYQEQHQVEKEDTSKKIASLHIRLCLTQSHHDNSSSHYILSSVSLTLCDKPQNHGVKNCVMVLLPAVPFFGSPSEILVVSLAQSYANYQSQVVK